MKYIAIDFEYNNTKEKRLNLICVATKEIDSTKPTEDTKTRGFDLRTLEGKKEFVGYINLQPRHTILLAYNVEAEARSFLSLGINPHGPGFFKWIDLYLEYKMLLNHWDKYGYGTQLIKGKIKHTRKKGKWDIVREVGGANFDKAEKNLAAACYKMLGIVIDTDHKTKMRDIIISQDPQKIDESFLDIIEYCKSDVKHLYALKEQITAALYSSGIPWKNYFEQAHQRARYSVSTAKMVALGYPIDVAAAHCFTHNVHDILDECKRDINEKTRTELGFELFRYRPAKVYKNGKTHTYKDQGEFEQKKLQVYIQGKYPNWTLSEKTKLPSLKEEIVSHMSGARHDYSDDPIDQLLRFTRLKQSLNGFMPARKGKDTIWDSTGMDGRVRPFFNIFGSQSSRSQPSSTSFIPLKSAWMRYLIHPPKGKMIVGLDFASQEFLIAALASKDEAMVRTYQSGDPYLGFAKESGQCPKSATRKTHGHIRDINKPAVLGILYKMGPKTLANQISKGIGREFPEHKAENIISLFGETYPDYETWGWDQRHSYNSKKFLQLVDGWTMFGDNDNWRSIVNFGVQGLGGVVMRDSVFDCEDHGIDIIFTLHDALYGEFEVNDWDSVRKFAQCMVRGFSKACGVGRGFSSKVFKPVQIRIDGAGWGLGIDNFEEPLIVEGVDGGPSFECPIKTSDRYIDPRAQKDFDKFKKYMTLESIF